MEISTAARGELVKLIHELWRKVEILEAENAQLREKLGQIMKEGSGKSGVIPFAKSRAMN